LLKVEKSTIHIFYFPIKIYDKYWGIRKSIHRGSLKDNLLRLELCKAFILRHQLFEVSKNSDCEWPAAGHL